MLTAAATRIAGRKDEVSLEGSERARERVGTKELLADAVSFGRRRV